MNFLVSILPAIVVLGVLIIVHEWGHFIACRITGVKVDKFSVGFGPEIFHWQGRETKYVVCLFPLGGFVKPAGEEASDIKGKGMKKGDFLASSVWARIFIVCSGVIMNYVLAFILFFIIFVSGRPVTGTVIGGFVEGYPAKVSQLVEGDRVLAINESQVETWSEMIEALGKTEGVFIDLTIERTNQTTESDILTVTIQPKVEEVTDVFGESIKVKRMGIRPHPKAFVYEKYSPLQALKMAWDTEVAFTVMTHKALFYLITGKLSPKNLAGPLGIVKMSGQAAAAGIMTLLQLMAILSVSLAVINLLPIPALDGGHLVFLLIEVFRRKPVSHKFQEKVSTAGFILLMALMVFVIYNDLVNLEALDKIKSFFK